MSQNRGKSIEDCLAEVEAEQAYQKHLTDPAELKKSRQRITHLRNRIQKLNEEHSAATTLNATDATRRVRKPSCTARDHRRWLCHYTAGHQGEHAFTDLDEMTHMRARIALLEKHIRRAIDIASEPYTPVAQAHASAVAYLKELAK